MTYENVLKEWVCRAFNDGDMTSYVPVEDNLLTPEKIHSVSVPLTVDDTFVVWLNNLFLCKHTFTGENMNASALAFKINNTYWMLQQIIAIASQPVGTEY